MEIRAAVQENRLADRSRVTEADYACRVAAGRVWVSESSGRIVGFAAGDPCEGTIWALFVLPEAEGSGHGSALLDATCADLAAAGCRTAMLTTDQGTRAERFYRHRGWRETGRVGLAELRFERELDP
jgi:GNAT superfamily N-acetyltransferase